MSVQSTSPSQPARRFRGRLARTILIILLPLVILPILLIGGILYYRSYTTIREQITNQLSTMVVAQSDQIATRIKVKENFLTQLVENRMTFTWPIDTAIRLKHDSPSFTSARNQILQEFELASATESERSFERFVIVRPDKTILIASNPNWEELSLSGSVLEQFIGETKTLALYNSPPLYTDRFLIYSSKPYSKTNEIVATIIGISDAVSSRRDLEIATTIHPTARAYFFMDDGLFINLDPQRRELMTFQPSEGEKVNTLPLIESNQGIITNEFTSFDNKLVLAYVKWIPDLKSGMVVELPIEAISGPLNALAPFTIILIVAMVLIFGFIIFRGTTYLVKPLIMLSDDTRGFAEGEWQRRADVKRDDEIGLLAYSFNQMADELTSLYRSLEMKVDERTKQIRTAAEVAQIASSAPSLQELLHRMVSMLVERFGYYDASIFLIDETRSFAVLRESTGVEDKSNIDKEFKLPVGSNSIIGWVTSHNEPRVSSDVTTDPLYLKDDLLQQTRSEAVIPIAIGDFVLGALDVQSSEADAFAQEDIVVLQTLANQVATAIQNVRLLEATKINLEEASLLYHGSRQISQADNPGGIFQATAQALKQTSYIAAILTVEEKNLKVFSVSYPDIKDAVTGFDFLAVKTEELMALLPPNKPLVIAEINKTPEIPPGLLEMVQSWRCEYAAFIPISEGGALAALIILGQTGNEALTSTILQPFANLAELISTNLEKVQAETSMTKRLNELQTLNAVSQAIAIETNPGALYQVIHNAISQSMGMVNFLIAIYEQEREMIQIPYMYDGEKVMSLDPFPMGEGLTSVLIRSRQPLLLAKLDEEHLRELGAKVVGAPAKSWLGVPLIVQGEAIGALILQDMENEGRFTEDDLRLLSTLAAQISASIRNTRLLESTRQQAERERLLYEVTSRIRNSADMQKILATTASELGKVLGARRARIEIDTQGNGKRANNPEVDPNEITE